jgi:hypothetical protein
LRDRDIERADQLESALLAFSNDVKPLPGIFPFENRLALIEQFLESIRRVQYVSVIRDKPHSGLRADPMSNMFDPLKAAALHKAHGNLEEACWLVFLATHFGKHKTAGWQLVRDVYGALGSVVPWNWERISSDPQGLRHWLNEYYNILTSDGTPRRFGNHRKYETLRPSSDKGTGAVVASYVNWVLEYGSHAQLFQNALAISGGEPRMTFRYLYESMNVLRFGRTAKFDYLTMLSNLELSPIKADSAYLVNATGPLRGARLLFGGSVSAVKLTEDELDAWLVVLAKALNLGMQEMEDALCNWQKSPGRFRQFRG